MKKGSKKKSATNLIKNLTTKYKKTFKKAENPGIKKKYLKSSSLCKVTFKLPKEAALEAQNVTIAGDFNDWNANETLMKRLKDVPGMPMLSTKPVLVQTSRITSKPSKQ